MGEAQEGDGAAMDPDGSATMARATILVVGDEPLVRMLVVDVLVELGYDVLEAGDGASALRHLRSSSRVDLLVTDVGLPNGMNGRQVANAARNLRPGLKVLFITGYAENAVLNHGDLEPSMGVITKPFAMEELARQVGVILAEGRARWAAAVHSDGTSIMRQAVRAAHLKVSIIEDDPRLIIRDPCRHLAIPHAIRADRTPKLPSLR